MYVAFQCTHVDNNPKQYTSTISRLRQTWSICGFGVFMSSYVAYQRDCVHWYHCAHFADVGLCVECWRQRSRNYEPTSLSLSVDVLARKHSWRIWFQKEKSTPQQGQDNQLIARRTWCRRQIMWSGGYFFECFDLWSHSDQAVKDLCELMDNT